MMRLSGVRMRTIVRTGHFRHCRGMVSRLILRERTILIVWVVWLSSFFKRVRVRTVQFVVGCLTRFLAQRRVLKIRMKNEMKQFYVDLPLTTSSVFSPRTSGELLFSPWTAERQVTSKYKHLQTFISRLLSGQEDKVYIKFYRLFEIIVSNRIYPFILHSLSFGYQFCSKCISSGVKLFVTDTHLNTRPLRQRNMYIWAGMVK